MAHDHILRTRFKKDIVCEFLLPHSLSDKKEIRIIIFAGGMPSVPDKEDLLTFWAEQGYWVFFPRYRGSWESGGEFLKNSPAKDIKDVIDGIHAGFDDLWSRKTYKINPDKLYLFGSSFGGPAVLLNSKDERVDNVIALSPAIDWREPSPDEPLDEFYTFIKNAFGQGYRMSKRNWNKLAGGSFYNPATQIDKIDGGKTLIIHAEDDGICTVGPVKKFCQKTGATLKLYKRGYHFGLSKFMESRMYNQITKFLNKK